MRPQPEDVQNLSSGTTSLADAFAMARNRLGEREACALFRDLLSISRTEIAASPDQLLADGDVAKLTSSIVRRCRGEPLAYVTGRRGFRTIELAVGPSVLIPRWETEELVQTALEHIASSSRVLDLGTGSGCIALAIRKETGADVTASDVSPRGLEVCRRNSETLGLGIQLVQSCWYESIDGIFDVIVSNPPYVESDDPHFQRGDLLHEPRLALDGGPDGLAGLRHVVAGAPAHLSEGGRLLVEHGCDQQAQVQRLFTAAGFADIATHHDLGGLPRVTQGALP